MVTDQAERRMSDLMMLAALPRLVIDNPNEAGPGGARRRVGAKIMERFAACIALTSSLSVTLQGVEA